jgi:Tfp pilus assembly protein PilZ
LISAGTRYSMGQRVSFSFTIPTTPDAIEVGATVRWSDDKATGLQFDGLRARDVWALNKFFEQLPAAS